MRQFTPRLGVSLLGASLLAACGPTAPQRTVDLLHQRLHTRMEAEVRSGTATIQDLPNGALVTISDPANATRPTPTTVNARTDMIEALLDPALLRIGVVPPGNLPPYMADGRSQAWQADFTRTQIGQSLQQPSYMPPPQPDSTTIAIQVVCPHRGNQTWGYTDWQHRPGCY